MCMQSTGQGWALQLLLISRAGQAVPPYLAFSTTLLRYCLMPPPHFSVQGSIDQADTLQCTAAFVGEWLGDAVGELLGDLVPAPTVLSFTHLVALLPTASRHLYKIE